jgi:predicted short-subunit dehydrogenase-like oxidoreductase (DUF2520 family)
MFERLVIVGPGRLGLALGYALWQADAVGQLTYCGRRPDPPSHPLFGQGVAEYHFGLLAPPPGTDAVILAVPAGVLPELAHALAAQGPPAPETVVLHTAGALSTEVLGPLHAVGYSVGTVHPLQSVGHSIRGAEHLVGSAFAVSGEGPARQLGRRLVLALGGHALEVGVHRRPQVHAASVLVSNGLAALLSVSNDLLVRAGVERDEARAALLSLAGGSLSDLEAGVLPPGPIADGDHEAVDLHLRSLQGDARELYLSMSRVLLDGRDDGRRPADAADALRILLGNSRPESSEDDT